MINRNRKASGLLLTKLINLFSLILLMLKTNDLLILKHLREDARKSLAKIAREERIPISTLFSKVNKLESSVIKSSTSLLDFSKLGYSLTTAIFLNLKDNSKKEAIDFLAKHPNTNCLSKINNGFDLFLEAIFDNMKSYIDFCGDLKKLNTKTRLIFFVVEELKKEDFLTREEHLGLFKD